MKLIYILIGVLMLAASASAWQSSWWNTARVQTLEKREEIVYDIPMPVPTPTPTPAPTPVVPGPPPVAPTPVPMPPVPPTFYNVEVPAMSSNYLVFAEPDHSYGRSGNLRFGVEDKTNQPSTGVLVRFDDLSQIGGHPIIGVPSLTFTVAGYVPLHTVNGGKVYLSKVDFDWTIDSTYGSLVGKDILTGVGELTVKVSYDVIKKLTYITLSGDDLGTLIRSWIGGPVPGRVKVPNQGIYIDIESLGITDGEIITFSAFSDNPPVLNVELSSSIME